MVKQITVMMLFLIFILLLIHQEVSSHQIFKKAKNALHNLVQQINVHGRQAGVTIINYSDLAEMIAGEYNIEKYEQDRIIGEIDNMQHMAKGTATGVGLQMAKDHCDMSCRPLREGAARAFVLFTDGQWNKDKDPKPVAQAIRDSPTYGTVYTVGIGDLGANGQTELEAIAADRDNVLYISSYQQLTERINAISKDICELPAFVLPKVLYKGAVKGNRTRYYKMNTTGKRALYQIDFTNTQGRSTVYTSTTNKKPGPATQRSSNDMGNSKVKNTYTASVVSSAKHFYFAVRGLQPVNEFEFVVRINNLNN